MDLGVLYNLEMMNNTWPIAILKFWRYPSRDESRVGKLHIERTPGPFWKFPHAGRLHWKTYLKACGKSCCCFGFHSEVRFLKHCWRFWPDRKSNPAYGFMMSICQFIRPSGLDTICIYVQEFVFKSGYTVLTGVFLKSNIGDDTQLHDSRAIFASWFVKEGVSYDSFESVFKCSLAFKSNPTSCVLFWYDGHTFYND